MEVSRIGSRFYENAAQSGKKVKGKQQDGFAYELQKSYDEKYRSEDTDETGMTAADGAQASGIAEFGIRDCRVCPQSAHAAKLCNPGCRRRTAGKGSGGRRRFIQSGVSL